MKKFNEYIKENSSVEMNSFKELFSSTQDRLKVPITMSDLFYGAEILILTNDEKLLQKEARTNDWWEFTIEEFLEKVHPDLMSEPPNNDLIEHFKNNLTTHSRLFENIESMWIFNNTGDDNLELLLRGL